MRAKLGRVFRSIADDPGLATARGLALPPPINDRSGAVPIRLELSVI
jgi:hypothetical protein